MILKKKFVKREIMGDCILVPIGQNEFNGLITLNNMASFIWDNIESSKDEEDLLQKILDEYEVEREVANADLDEFLQTLKDADII
ncbi:PqqD family protein [Clostridium sp. 1001270J_160509_D11]|uniref:PqqD family protein n=1 Tax=Clostridium sp. 1001270J_160509_D11 TaxID=2787103 RepID=UPI0018A9BF92|nr:PqqD family protein [Clostridium sp. 1001270J_160509_D11]